MNLSNCITHTNIYEALKQPEHVYSLKLRFHDAEIFTEKSYLFGKLRKLKLSGANIEEFSFGFACHLPLLDELELHCTSVSNFPLNFSSLNIKSLILKNNRELESLDVALDAMPNLEMLEISYDEPKDFFIPESLFYCEHIRTIVMEGLNLKKIPQSIAMLNQLENLSLANNQIDKIPEPLFKCKKLKVLNLSGNKLRSLPGNLYHLYSLNKLDISNNLIRSLPKNLGLLEQLKELSASCNNLHELPETLPNLSNLEVLCLNNNHLKTIKPDLSPLTKLKELSIRNNLLKELPSSIVKANSLEELDAGCNQMEFLREDICLLRKLKYLDMTSNKINYLPGLFGLLGELNYLNLSNNLLSDLPESFSALQKMETLDLSYNKFDAFPAELCDCQSIQHLYFTKNRLRSIQGIHHLSNLRLLCIEMNRLSSLPENFHALKNLHGLYMAWNKLTRFPKSLQGMNIRKLNMEGNKVCDFPAGIVLTLTSLCELNLKDNNIGEINVNILTHPTLKRFIAKENPINKGFKSLASKCPDWDL